MLAATLAFYEGGRAGACRAPGLCAGSDRGFRERDRAGRRARLPPRRRCARLLARPQDGGPSGNDAVALDAARGRRHLPPERHGRRRLRARRPAQRRRRPADSAGLMPLAALGLALGAAVLHASWNLVLRAREDTEAATAVAVLVLVVGAAPVAAATWHVGSGAWPYIAGSGALELVYVVLLAAAYRRYELSVVYPVARGLAPVAALVLAVAVAGASASTAEVAGVVVVAAGVLLVRGPHGGRGALLRLAVAAAIGRHSLIDRYGVRHAAAVPYPPLVVLPAAVPFPPAGR